MTLDPIIADSPLFINPKTTFLFSCLLVGFDKLTLSLICLQVEPL